jgi:hypothetical protein
MPSSCTTSSLGEAAGVLDNHRAHAVALDLVEEGGETLAAFDRIGAAHRGVIVLGDDLEPCALGDAMDGRTLAFVGILIGADIGGRRCAQVGNSRRAGFGYRQAARAVCASTVARPSVSPQ